MQEIISAAIGKLPIPKRMRWGMGAAEFVRPVHWILLLFGDEPVSLTLLDVDAGTESYGHRFHHPQAIPLNSSSEKDFETFKEIMCNPVIMKTASIFNREVTKEEEVLRKYFNIMTESNKTHNIGIMYKFKL